MENKRIAGPDVDALWRLQIAYKREIGEEQPTDRDRERLKEAIEADSIRFYGAWDDGVLVGMCSVTTGFSTFDYAPSGVFEDFYLCPAYRHRGAARELLHFAYRDSGVSSLTVGCAECDVPMYKSLGFTVHLGRLLAFGG